MRLDRSARVGDEMQKVISQILRTEVRDPRIPMLTSVLEVKMSHDLSHATVYLSVMGSEKEKEDLKAAVAAASGFIRREVCKRVNLRVAPELHYVFDESIEKGMKLMNLIDKTIKEDESRADIR
jgi:ribosome-binding factor A